jgi:hypothetical protein
MGTKEEMVSTPNFYQPPSAPNYDEAPRAAPGASAEVPGEVLDLLAQTRPWVRFLAVLGFIACGFLLLGALFVLAAGAAAGGGEKTLIGLIYLPLAVLYMFPSLFLWRYGGAIGELLAGGGVPKLVDAIRHQKSFWRLIGILTLVILCLYILIIVVVGVGAVSAFKGLR